MVKMKRRYTLCLLLCFTFPCMYKGDSCADNCNAGCTEVDGGCSTTCKPGYYGRKCEYPLQCFKDDGVDYRGTKNITENDVPCQAWLSQEPIEHKWTSLPENYCRKPNPNSDDAKPWCYQIRGVRFGLCDIPRCSSQCNAPRFHVFGKIENPPDNGFYVGVEVIFLSGCGPGTWGKQKCLEGKTWSTGTDCEKIPWCLKPTITIPDGNIAPSRDNYYYNDKVNFTCNTGYESDGGYHISCQEDKTWSSLPKCNRVKCPLPNLNSNSDILDTKNEYKYQDVIEIGCKFGYKIVGQKNLVCQHDKSWSPAVPSCTPVPCPLPSLTVGVIILNSTNHFVFKDTVTVGCDQGYSLMGSTVFSCNGDGSWSGTFPTCLPLPCELPILPDGTSFTNFENKTYLYRDKLTIECKYTGLETELSCLADQTWGIIPNCTEVEKATKAPVTNEPSVLPTVLGGLLGALVVVALVIVAFFVYKRRTTAKANKDGQPFTPIDEKLEANNCYSNLGMNDTKNEADTQPNTTVYQNFEPIYSNEEAKVTKFRLENAVEYVREKKSQAEYFKQQFKEFKVGLQRPTVEALKDANKPKNKYRNIYPYDDNRVVLQEQNNDKNSSYVNATFIKDYDGSLIYIAAQGPIEPSVADFWRMVWEQNVGKIVMLTNVVENGKKKCIQYWPNNEGKSTTYGNITITLTSEDVYSEFTIRQLSFSKESSDSRRVIHYHFTAWPDKSVPKYASSLAEFRRKVVDTPNTSSGPPIIHCSAGIGRTGTFIALDIIMKESRHSGEADVISCVEHLREQRLNMVQTSEQFMFLHDVLIEEHDCDISTVAANDFQVKYRELQATDPKTKRKKLESVFDVLQKTSPTLGINDCETGKMESNKPKNRDIGLLPVDMYRPTILGGDYINAVYLPGYKDEHAFIVTQMPLPSTVNDFLNLILDRKISCVVMLNESTDKTCGIYWPQQGDSLSLGIFSVELLEETNKGEIKESKLKIENGEKTHIFTQLRVMSWSDKQNVPEDPSLFLRIMNQVQVGEFRQPLLFHCMNGSDKCGLLCSTIAIIDRLKLERNVVIQHVIKQMRSRRPQIIKNLEQFDFCYKVICAYLDEFEMYSNFN